VGVHYIIANIGGDSRESLRRFAREIIPAFADARTDAEPSASGASLPA
jgi:hypothetical protein